MKNKVKKTICDKTFILYECWSKGILNEKQNKNENRSWTVFFY